MKTKSLKFGEAVKDAEVMLVCQFIFTKMDEAKEKKI